MNKFVYIAFELYSYETDRMLQGGSHVILYTLDKEKAETAYKNNTKKRRIEKHRLDKVK